MHADAPPFPFPATSAPGGHAPTRLPGPHSLARCLVLTVLMTVLCSCNWIYAQMVSDKVADDLLAVETYSGRHQLPMLTFVLSEEPGGRWLSLTESRRTAHLLDEALGIRLEIGGEHAVLDLAGGFVSLSWARGDTLLTLIGELPYPELLKIAEGLEPVSR